MLADFGEPISTYTTEQAVEDGALVRVPRNLSNEAGFVGPVLVTVGLWSHVQVPKGMEGYQDLDGRLWDLLWMSRLAFSGGDPSDRMRTNIEVLFQTSPGRREKVKVWGVIDGAGLTLMKPEDY